MEYGYVFLCYNFDGAASLDSKLIFRWDSLWQLELTVDCQNELPYIWKFDCNLLEVK